MPRIRALPFAVWLGTGLVWGTTWGVIRLGLQDMPPFTFAAFLIGAPMLAVGNAAVGWAEQTIDTGTASLIIASVPLWMALLDRVFSLHETLASARAATAA